MTAAEEILIDQALENTEAVAETLILAAIRRGVVEPKTICAYALSVVLDAFFCNAEALPIYCQAVAKGVDDDAEAMASKRVIVEAMIMGLNGDGGAR
jgi:hypothetical protein